MTRRLLLSTAALLLSACEDGAPPVPAPQFPERYSLHPFEQRFGYSQAVRSGRTVYVSSTYAVDADGRLVGPGDFARQLDAAYANVARTLAAHGASFDDVVLERLYVTDMERFLAASDRRFRVHAPGALPALSVIEVRRLVDPGFLVAIEAVAELPVPEPDPADDGRTAR
jgi:enamine deaminase RidA (YjgF/YER057c/UK114 family)